MWSYIKKSTEDFIYSTIYSIFGSVCIQFHSISIPLYFFFYIIFILKWFFTVSFTSFPISRNSQLVSCLLCLTALVVCWDVIWTWVFSLVGYHLEVTQCSKQLLVVKWACPGGLSNLGGHCPWLTGFEGFRRHMCTDAPPCSGSTYSPDSYKPQTKHIWSWVQHNLLHATTNPNTSCGSLILSDVRQQAEGTGLDLFLSASLIQLHKKMSAKKMRKKWMNVIT